MAEVRPLRWHDLSFAYRLVGHGSSFDTELRLTAGDNGLKQRLLIGSGRLHAYVLREAGNGGVGQLHFPADGRHARLAYLAPSLEEANEMLWLGLLDGLTAMAGQRGAVSLAAEVDSGAPELEILRRAEFAVYAYQDLWVRPPAPIGGPVAPIRAASPIDAPAILALYSTLVPGLVKQVEQPPTIAGACYLSDGLLGPSGVAVIYRGARSALIEVYLRPEAQPQARGLINAVLTMLQAETRPVYYRLRRYIGWLDGILEDLGFEPLVSQAFMVRHTAARVRQLMPKMLPALEESTPVTVF